MMTRRGCLVLVTLAAVLAACETFASAESGPPYPPYHIGHQKWQQGRWIVVEDSPKRRLKVDSIATILPNKNVVLWLFNGEIEKDYTKQHIEFNCALRQIRPLLSLHDSAGQVRSVPGDSTWVSAIPESTGETLLRVACGPPWPDNASWLADTAPKHAKHAGQNSPAESSGVPRPEYPSSTSSGTSTQGNTLTSPGDTPAWRALLTMEDGSRISLDTTTEVHDPAGGGVVELLVEGMRDTRINDSTVSRTHVNHWMVDCSRRRYRFIGGEYYSSTGKLVHAIHNDRFIAKLPWDQPETDSPYAKTLAATCRVLSTLPDAQQKLERNEGSVRTTP